MNKAEAIDQIARSAEITKTAAGQVMKALEVSIKTHIDAGERVVLRGLGSFTRGEATQRTELPLTYTGYRRTTRAPQFSESKLCAEISTAASLNVNAAKRALDAFKGVMASALKNGDLV